MASGEDAGLKVKPETWEGVAQFLDSVQGDAAGSIYGYTGPGKNSMTTVIGLLARLRTGWGADDKGVETGVPATTSGLSVACAKIVGRRIGDRWLP